MSSQRVEGQAASWRRESRGAFVAALLFAVPLVACNGTINSTDADGGLAGDGSGGSAVSGSGGASGQSGSGGASGQAGTGGVAGGGTGGGGAGAGGSGGVGGSGNAGEPANIVDGWTVFEPQAGALVIHVSNSGNDANPGTLEAPKASFRAGYDAVREGQADSLLLERGGSWMLDDIFQWSKSGPAAANAGWMRIGAYGDENLPRPRLNSGTRTALVVTPGYQANRPLSHVAVTDIHLVAQGRLDNRAGAPEGAAGLQSVSVEYSGSGLPIQHLTVENVRIEGFSFGYSGSHDVEDLRVRRNIFTEIFNPGGNGTHGSAMLTEADGLLVEENVFYRIQHPDMPGVTEVSVFAHSAYIGAGANGVVSRGNIIIKATEGFMQRAGGTFERNVSAFNNIAHLSGQAWGVMPTPGGVVAAVHDNLMLNATSSMVLGNTANGTVLRNLIVRGPEGAAPIGVDLIEQSAQAGGMNVGVRNTQFEGNVLSGDFAYNVGDTASFSGLAFVDNQTGVGAIATTVASFVTSVGLTGDIDVYGRDLIARDRGNFRVHHLAEAMINHYREPLGLPLLQ